MSIRRMSTSSLTKQRRYSAMSTGTPQPISPNNPLSIPYVVVAGGGGGGNSGANGGGGAGGYRTSYGSDLSGAQSATEAPFTITEPTTFSISIGAGGGAYSNGSTSTFHTVSCTGGGRGSQHFGSPTSGGSGGGGSGGGGGDAGDSGASGTSQQGTKGGNSQHNTSQSRRSGGGGGAWTQGGNASSGSNGSGGQGAISTMVPSEAAANSLLVGQVSGSNVYFAGGGGGSGNATTGAGGLGGGGNGTVNTGGGGGPGTGGGAGIILFRIPSVRSVDFSVGVTYRDFEDGDDMIYAITATSTGSETVTIS